MGLGLRFRHLVFSRSFRFFCLQLGDMNSVHIILGPVGVDVKYSVLGVVHLIIVREIVQCPPKRYAPIYIVLSVCIFVFLFYNSSGSPLLYCSIYTFNSFVWVGKIVGVLRKSVYFRILCSGKKDMSRDTDVVKGGEKKIPSLIKAHKTVG